MEHPWDFLERHRGRDFEGEWPSIPAMLAITAGRFPDRSAFTTFDPRPLSLSYAQVLQIVGQAAAHLRASGIRPGDRVAVTGKNSPEWAVAYLSVLAAGAVVVPLDYQLTAEEARRFIESADVRAVFLDEEKYDILKPGAIGGCRKLSLSPARPGYVLDLPAEGHLLEKPAEEETAAILFTSGTTGIARGVMLSHRNLASDTYLSQALIRIRETDVFYALLPIHHSYTMTAVFLEAVSVGAEIVFGKRFQQKQIFDDLRQGRVTIFLGVPALFDKVLKGVRQGIREKGALLFTAARLLMIACGAVKRIFRLNAGKRIFGFILKKISMDQVRICISGGGPLAPSTFRQFNQLGIDFVQGYGLTETSPIVALNPVEAYRPRSVGKIIPQVEVKIVGAERSGRGEIAVRGPIVMQGYAKDDEATREILADGGFLLTGDVGYLDRKGFLYLTGRKKNLIVTAGGKNVYPEEIENRFRLYEEIEQVLVRGYTRAPQARAEEIEALIYPSEAHSGGSSPAEAGDRGSVHDRMAAIIQEVNARLKPYQRLSRFRILDEPLEITTTQKIKRYKVVG